MHNRHGAIWPMTDRYRTVLRKYLTPSHILVKLVTDLFYNRVNLVVEICGFGVFDTQSFQHKMIARHIRPSASQLLKLKQGQVAGGNRISPGTGMGHDGFGTKRVFQEQRRAAANIRSGVENRP
ncbi:hypothetical protein [Agrobacterium vitis]|uniref:hypothetical protein n=1 Tax=Agrobacterium vitis TaxID=373 RepID=UPI0015732D76|nr:hypothetical protein [Agrobacterium vitis]NSZ19483.1 hypothetical protein [Agrobacterium vitis]QZO06797.1 hypothetical protein K4831_21970 [Agrobacterium vitis]UJL91529.1 hypothetical protein AVF2S5_26490 [Agrobacterium vitis]